MKTNAKGIVAAAIACALTAGTAAGTALADPIIRIGGDLRWRDADVGKLVEIKDNVSSDPHIYVRDGGSGIILASIQAKPNRTLL